MSKKDLWISVSQIKDFMRCQRLWVLTRMWKIPTIKKAKVFGMGNILHAVFERWLDADDTGRNPKTGEVVELYPEGWRTWTEKDGTGGTITDDEAKLIQLHVENAIEKGILVRRTGRETEAEMKRKLIEGVILIGYIDLLITAEFELQDHKTCKSKRYALSAAKLAKDVQVLTYAHELVMRLLEEEGYNESNLPERINLVHNQFSKDPADPWCRSMVAKEDGEVGVSLQSIRNNWEMLKAIAMQMKKLAENVKKNYPDPKDWSKIEGPKDVDACNAYGGCPFMPVCVRRERLSDYIKRVEQANALQGKTLSQRSQNMSFFTDKMNQASAKTDPPAQEPAQEQAPVEEGKKLSFHEKMMLAAKKKKKQEQAEEAPPAAQEPASEPAPEAPAEETQEAAPAQEKPAKPAVNRFRPVTKTPAERKEAVEAATKPQEKPKAKAEPKKAGRKRSGFILCINCVPQPGGTKKVTSLANAVEEAEQAIAERLGAPSFAQADVWQRKDLIKAAAPELAESLGTSFVVARDGTMDEKAWIEALSRHAYDIIYGLR
jgi:hypothetical protein